MRSHFAFCLPSLIVLFFVCVFAEESGAQSAEEHFQSGVAAYQKNQTDEARGFFNQSLKLQPNNVEALYNLGLTELKAKNQGLALGLWRKALRLAPGHEGVANAIEYAERNIAQRSAGRGADFFESFRRRFLVYVPLSSFLLLNLVLFSFAGWILIRYFARRSNALDNEEPMPPLPYIGILFVFSFLLTGGLVLAKLYDLNLVRGTVLVERLEVKTSPDLSAATLFELFEGNEVIVRQLSGDWMQVHYPGGLTGWAPRASLYQSSERQL